MSLPFPRVVRDLHGYPLSFGHYIYTVGEPIVIERVDVTVRLTPPSGS